MQGVNQDQLCDNDGCALEVDGLPALIIEVVDLDHFWVDEPADLGEEPFEVGKEGRVVESPF